MPDLESIHAGNKQPVKGPSGFCAIDITGKSIWIESQPFKAGMCPAKMGGGCDQ